MPPPTRPSRLCLGLGPRKRAAHGARTPQAPRRRRARPGGGSAGGFSCRCRAIVPAGDGQGGVYHWQHPSSHADGEQVAGTGGAASARPVVLGPDADRRVRVRRPRCFPGCQFRPGGEALYRCLGGLDNRHPVILPGHDDRGGYRDLFHRRETTARFRRDSHGGEQPPSAGGAVRGYRRPVAQSHPSSWFFGGTRPFAVLDWRSAGFVPGIAPQRFTCAAKAAPLPPLHVRIAWRDAAGGPLEVSGPVCLGGGRFVGLGLFCAVK